MVFPIRWQVDQDIVGGPCAGTSTVGNVHDVTASPARIERAGRTRSLAADKEQDTDLLVLRFRTRALPKDPGCR